MEMPPPHEQEALAEHHTCYDAGQQAEVETSASVVDGEATELV